MIVWDFRIQIDLGDSGLSLPSYVTAYFFAEQSQTRKLIAEGGWTCWRLVH